ncbi:SurA N-terminal domain-containing protein [Roseomonas sp. CCTCC AB2023176]|uniref:peptidylprolyl isomerase n=1 Tax=Roseomonas sp. CCTCC AB2023176 TaxID=3342640 RepID=UPI0035DB8CCC
MLTAFRRLAGTWFARGLFILLILSFAVWGIEDVVRNFGRDTAVARVGGERIELTEAQNAARRETQRLLRQLGPTFEANEGFRQAVARQAVEQLIADRALTEEARRLGVASSAEAIRAYTFAIPTFRGVDGRFSQAILQQFMRQNDMTEADFVRLVASDLRRQQLVGAVRAGARAPQAMTRPLLAYTLEQRAAEVVELPLLSAPEIPEATEAQLRRFHENNPERFSSPEYREATLALVSAETLAGGVTVPDAEIEANLDAARTRLAASEKRTLEQVLVNDRAAADAIRTAWAGGADAAAIRQQAEAAGGTLLELGTLDRDGLPLPSLAEAAFAAPEGGVTQPVQSPFGWHVLRVAAIQAAEQKSEADLRAEVRAELAREKAADRAYEEANRLDDAFAGGATVEEAVSRLNLPP